MHKGIASFGSALIYSSGLLRRDLLISPRIFFCLILFSWLARVGLVGWRFFAGMMLISTS